MTDQHTCLMWEQKTGTFDGFPFIDCSGGACSDPHEVDNFYTWSATGTAPDGAVYTDFLARVNGELCDDPTCTGLGGHTDWRIPSVAELRSILAASFVCTVGPPCIDSIFVDRPTYDTVPSVYWSATTNATNPMSAWFVLFDDGEVVNGNKPGSGFVRAVRGGS